MNTPTPAHVALVTEAHDATIAFFLAHEPDASYSARMANARQAILDALAQPALAAPVLPVGFLNTVAALMKTIDAYAYDYQTDGKLAAMRGWVLVEIGTALAAQQPTPAVSPTMRTVSEKEAMQGGRWVSSDDVQRMAQQINRAMYPDVVPPVNCLLCDIVAEVCARLESQVMQPVEASPPKNASEIRDFIGSNFDVEKRANCNSDDFSEYDRAEPSDNDRYTVSAHDLLSSFREWVEVAAPVAPIEPTEIERLAKVAIRECPWKPNQHPNDWSDAALQVCRAVVSRAALSAPQPELSDAQIAEVWGTYDQGIGTRRDLMERILALQAKGATS